MQTTTRTATATATPDLSVKNFLTPQGVARRFDVNITTVYRWLMSGRLKGMRVAGHRYLIDPADLAALLQPAGPR